MRITWKITDLGFTVFVNEKPVHTFCSYMEAIELVVQLKQEMKK